MFKFLQAIIILLLANSVDASSQPQDVKYRRINNKFHSIEHEYHLKIGVYALDTNNGNVITYHANDRFPFQSTCKFMGVSALLAQESHSPLLQKKVLIRPQDILFWHPISGKYVNQYVTLQTLAEGALSYSDNPAINIIISQLGGLKSINQFARSIGNSSFKMEHLEINLNSNPEKDADSSTPQDMGLSVQKILLGSALSAENKALLVDWMMNNTTCYKRIRAGVPLGWAVADKTGSGSYGIANDIGIAWSPACKPIVLSIFTISDKSNAQPNDEVIAKITHALFEELEQHEACYQATHLT
jgi:beta-lactamase class A